MEHPTETKIQRDKALKGLLEISCAVLSAPDVDTLLHRLLERIVSIMAADAGAVLLYDEAAQGLVVRQIVGAPFERAPGSRVPVGEGLAGRVTEEVRPLVVRNAQKEPKLRIAGVKSRAIKSILGVPLSLRGRPIGAMHLDYRAELDFSPGDIQLLETFATCVAEATESSRQRDLEHRRLAQLSALEEVASSRNLLRSIVDNAPFCIIYLNSDLRVQWANPYAARKWGVTLEQAVGKSIFGAAPWLIKHPAALLLKDALRTGEPQAASEMMIAPPGQEPVYWDVTVVPVKEASGKVLGLLKLGADVTEKVHTRQRLEQRALREKAVSEVALAVNAGASLYDVLITAIERVVSALKSTAGGIFLIEPDGKYLTGFASYERRGLKAEGVRIPVDPALGEVLREKRPKFITAAQAGVLSRRRLERIGVAGMLVAPLFVAGRVIGVLMVGGRPPGEPPAPESMSFVADLASQCAIAIDKARLMDELRWERERLQTIIEQMPGGVATAEGPEGRIVLVNRGATEIFGRGLPVGTRVKEFPRLLGLKRPDERPLRPEETPLAQSLWRRRPVRDLEMMVTRPDGTTRHVLASAQPIFDQEGNVREAVMVLQDITLIKQAQKRAEESAEAAGHRAAELDALIRSMTEGILIVDNKGRVVLVNDVGKELWQIPTPPTGECLPEHYRHLDIRHVDDSPMPFEEWPINRALRGERFTGYEVLYVRSDGRRLFLSFSGSAVLNHSGRVRMAINVYRDITRLRELERQREDYMRTIAHDLRSPLTIILGQAQMAEQFARAGQTDKVGDSVRAIITGAKRMDTMIRDLSDSARLEAGRLELRRKPIDLVAFINDLRQRLAGIVDLSRIRVVAGKGLPLALADEDRLERIVMNLLTNALKYSPPDTAVTVKFWARDAEVVTSITDRGIGIAPEDIEHLFERFYRAKGVRKTEGLGLGLYITKMLVEAHGGRIWVRSKPGQGSTFYFSLPAPKPADSTA